MHTHAITIYTAQTTYSWPNTLRIPQIINHKCYMYYTVKWYCSWTWCYYLCTTAVLTIMEEAQRWKGPGNVPLNEAHSVDLVRPLIRTIHRPIHQYIHYIHLTIYITIHTSLYIPVAIYTNASLPLQMWGRGSIRNRHRKYTRTILFHYTGTSHCFLHIW